MRKSRFSVEQIVYALMQVESRQMSVGDQCRKLGISEQTFYQWKKKYAGMLLVVTAARVLRLAAKVERAAGDLHELEPALRLQDGAHPRESRAARGRS